ncbi:MAG: class II aldolase/adducin family protein [Usitatibacter sp.]
MAMMLAGRRLVELGLSPATSGNLSARARNGYIITPSGAAGYATFATQELSDHALVEVIGPNRRRAPANYRSAMREIGVRHQFKEL